MKTILIMNQKGGVSKTSCCIELCNFLAQLPKSKKGPNVLAIDLDAQQQFSKYCSDNVVLTKTSPTGKLIETPNALSVMMGEHYILDAVQTINVEPFLDKVATARAVAIRKQLLADEKKEIKESILSKNEIAKLCKNADALAKADVLAIKKQSHAEECEDPSFDILPASQRLATSAKVFTEYEDIFILNEILSDEDVQNKYDYCVIDSAPARSPLLNQSLVAADYIIIPTDRDMGGLDGIQNTLMDIENFRNRNMTNAKVLGIFLVRLEKQLIQTEIEDSIIETARDFNVPMFESCTKNSPLAKESRLASQSVGEYKSNSPLAFEYYEFMREVLDKIKEMEQENGK